MGDEKSAGMKNILAFAREITFLVSKGYSEKIEDLKKQAEDGKLVSYILEKYKDDLLSGFGENPNIDFFALEQEFENHFVYDTDVIKHKDVKNDDGLLLILLYIFNILETM